MTYAIGSIVYGINLKGNRKFPDDIDMLTESEVITTEYSGGGDPPTYIGPCIDVIDECNDTEVSDLRLEPTDKHKAEFTQQLNSILEDAEVTDAFKDYLRGLQPTVFITWGSS